MQKLGGDPLEGFLAIAIPVLDDAESEGEVLEAPERAFAPDGVEQPPAMLLAVDREAEALHDGVFLDHVLAWKLNEVLAVEDSLVVRRYLLIPLANSGPGLTYVPHELAGERRALSC